MLNGCQQLERKEFILWLSVEVIGVFLDKDLGVPIPVFYKKNGNEILLNSEIINHIQELFSEHGADIWWDWDVKNLLPENYVKDSDLWEKGTDTMDVWFDSGSSWGAVCEQEVN